MTRKLKVKIEWKWRKGHDFYVLTMYAVYWGWLWLPLERWTTNKGIDEAEHKIQIWDILHGPFDLIDRT